MNRVSAIIAISGALLGSHVGFAQTKERTVARLFWQDSSDQSLRWGDLKQGETWKLENNKVAGFPKLDQDKQSMVQMQQSEELVLTGIHDTEDGTFQSGWVAIESGVVRDAHGDHFHWKYATAPTVCKTQLDDKQGNPAHVYTYDGNYYLANDKKDGVTILSPNALRSQASSPAQFVNAGGGHITIAAVRNQVCYGTWIDREGDNLGRVDVVGLESGKAKKYSFQLPTGGIHGATANSGKVFFAPSDGICWVAADSEIKQNAQTVQVNHLSLGQDAAGKPKRTGAFTNHRNFVLFSTGRGETSELCITDAASPKPSVHKLPLQAQPGNSITSPVCLRTKAGEDLVLLFEESANGEQAEQLHVVDMDPNRDGKVSDAKVVKSIAVGKSLIEGHSGHHELVALGSKAVAFTNPGDASLWVVATSDWSVTAQLKIGGTPTRLLAVGGN